MDVQKTYKEVNRKSWNKWTDVHMESDFYNLEGFLEGKTSLNEIELNILGDIKGKSVLHLQCHFGQDTISFARMGAAATGVDLSDKAIQRAEELAQKCGAAAKFICCDVYGLPNHLDEQFDIVFTSYGTITWLPDIDKWAKVVSRFLKPDGRFVFAEFHPMVWMFDDDLKEVKHSYFNADAIVETKSGTYANTDADIHQDYITWNHGMGEVVMSLIQNGLEINSLEEFNYSPYPCFNGTEEFEKGKHRIKHLGNKMPMVYAIEAIKKGGL